MAYKAQNPTPKKMHQVVVKPKKSPIAKNKKPVTKGKMHAGY